MILPDISEFFHFMKVIVKIHPDYARLEPFIREMVFGEESRPQGARVIYAGRNLLYRADIGGVPVVVKEFRKPNLINSFVYTTLRESKARRSFENALTMLRLGFLTPQPIAYAEVREGLRLMKSIYVCAELTDAHEMRHWEDFDNADTLLPAFSKEIWRLHSMGVLHKDFSPGNILYTGDAESGYRFYYVDLNRMKFGVRKDARLMSMFRAINLSERETARLARLYAKYAGKEEERTVREAEAALAGYLRKRARKRRLKKLFSR